MNAETGRMGSIPVEIIVRAQGTGEEIFGLDHAEGLPVYADMSDPSDIKATLGDRPMNLIAADFFEMLASDLRSESFEVEEDKTDD